MLKWLLTGGHLGLIITLIFIFSVAVSYYSLLFIRHYGYGHEFVQKSKFKFLSIFTTTFVLFALMMTVLIFTKRENQYDGDWKTLESSDNKIELKITIKEKINAKAKEIDLDIGSELGEKATLLKNNKEYAGKIEAVMDGKKATRNVELKSIDGKFLPDSKISKVEYRKIIGYQANLFGLVGYVEPSEYDGELRLMIEQTEDLDLKNMFNN